MSPLRVVIAPDSFKGTASAAEAANAISEGWASVRPRDRLVLAPMADGGEGTIDAFAAAVPGARRMPVTVEGPVGHGESGLVDAEWLLLPHEAGASGATGVVELAAASGITHLDALAPMAAHTRGFGRLIRAALDAGMSRLVLAIGGSASTDGGVGALSALGARFLCVDGTEVADGGGGLASLAAVDLGGLVPLPVGGAVVLSDVTAPLLGRSGSAAVFAPQKGASTGEVSELEAGLARLALLLEADPDQPGAGAAGGTGFGLLAWGATIASGAAEVASVIGLDGVIRDADLVITGEGSFDEQSGTGKAPGEVASIAQRHGVPVAVVAGRITADVRELAAAVSLTDLAGGGGSAQAEALHWLTEAGRALAESSAITSGQPRAAYCSRMMLW